MLKKVLTVFLLLFSLTVLYSEGNFLLEKSEEDIILLSTFNFGMPVFLYKNKANFCSVFGYKEDFTRLLESRAYSSALKSKICGVSGGIASLFSYGYGLGFSGLFYTLADRYIMEAVAEYNGGFIYKTIKFDVKEPIERVEMDVSSGLPRFFLGGNRYRANLFGYSDEFIELISTDETKDYLVKMRYAGKNAGTLSVIATLLLQVVWILPIALTFGRKDYYSEEAMIKAGSAVASISYGLSVGLFFGAGVLYTKMEKYATNAVAQYNAGVIPYRF